jgi:hypothetical protein
MTNKKLKCPKCGYEKFTGDVFYNAEIEIYESGNWNLMSELEGEELDTGSIQCLECSDDFPYPVKVSNKFVQRYKA